MRARARTQVAELVLALMQLVLALMQLQVGVTHPTSRVQLSTCALLKLSLRINLHSYIPRIVSGADVPPPI